MSLPTNPCDHGLGETAELTGCQDEIQHLGMIDDFTFRMVEHLAQVEGLDAQVAPELDKVVHYSDVYPVYRCNENDLHGRTRLPEIGDVPADFRDARSTTQALVRLGVGRVDGHGDLVQAGLAEFRVVVHVQ